MFEQVLVHTKGVWTRRPFVLADWQHDDLIVPVFGWCEYSEQFGIYVRTYRLVWIEIPRKNSKSEICAGVVLVLLAADSEEGAEIYGAAIDTKQAAKVFDVCARMVELSPYLRSRLRVVRHTRRIINERMGSYYEVVPADAAGNLGHNVHGAVVDEVLTQPNGNLWDAFKQGMGTRTQPLMVGATTAGNDPVGFASQEHEISVKVAKDPTLEPRRYVYIRGVPKNADWRDEQVWAQANPALGDFLSIETLRDEAREAQLSTRKQNAFRQFRLNQWVQNASRWIDLGRWDAGAGLTPALERLKGRPVYGGLDLSTTTDLTSLAYWFPPQVEPGAPPAEWDKYPSILIVRSFIPEARLESLNERTSDLADQWVAEGFLTVTEGDVLDYAAVRIALNQDVRRHRWEMRTLGYDPYNATEFVEQRLGAQDGFPILPVRQGYLSMSPPSKEFERLFTLGRVQHGGNPVLRWMADNVVARTDPAGNIKPDKEKSGDAIDGIVASIIALYCAMRAPQARRSAYEDRGLTVA